MLSVSVTSAALAATPTPIVLIRPVIYYLFSAQIAGQHLMVVVHLNARNLPHYHLKNSVSCARTRKKLYQKRYIRLE